MFNLESEEQVWWYCDDILDVGGLSHEGDGGELENRSGTKATLLRSQSICMHDARARCELEGG